ncbi:competence type IV pilus minor pilin ComGD [Pueribacillus sp. YX66]|uniref:competence type IV pilus minor pilin ComGD n=1 Tax=Pueribacillus sp. YX66 TaxID=3229242 RepID=UPI00358D8DEE
MANEKGYTLFELIIVITILGIVILIAIPSFTPISEAHEVEHFFEQLEDDLYFTQVTALSRGKPVLLDFRTSSSLYQVRMDNKVIVQRNYPEHFTVEKGSMNTTIEFNLNGNIRNPGTIFVDTNNGKYKLTFQLGKGRFDVTKL